MVLPHSCTVSTRHSTRGLPRLSSCTRRVMRVETLHDVIAQARLRGGSSLAGAIYNKP